MCSFLCFSSSSSFAFLYHFFFRAPSIFLLRAAESSAGHRSGSDSLSSDKASLDDLAKSIFFLLLTPVLPDKFLGVAAADFPSETSFRSVFRNALEEADLEGARGGAVAVRIRFRGFSGVTLSAVVSAVVLRGVLLLLLLPWRRSSDLGALALGRSSSSSWSSSVSSASWSFLRFFCFLAFFFSFLTLPAPDDVPRLPPRLLSLLFLDLLSLPAADELPPPETLCDPSFLEDLDFLRLDAILSSEAVLFPVAGGGGGGGADAAADAANEREGPADDLPARTETEETAEVEEETEEEEEPEVEEWAEEEEEEESLRESSPASSRRRPCSNSLASFVFCFFLFRAGSGLAVALLDLGGGEEE
jgi:hypothetical protein